MRGPMYVWIPQIWREDQNEQKKKELSDHKTIQREDFQHMRMKRSKSLRRVCIAEHLQKKRNNKN